jgi:hypothetical protein
MLLQREDSRGFEVLLRRAIKDVHDPTVLTPHGWLWLLGWARSQNVNLRGDLLLKLTETWASPFMQIPAIDLATRQRRWTPKKRVSSLEDFGHPWVRALLKKCVESAPAEPEEAAGEQQIPREELPPLRPGLAESVLIALLQLGSDISIDAAATLLRYEWPGRTALLSSYHLLWEALDEETQEIWNARLRTGAPRR